MNECGDLYAILGLTPEASQTQINHAYRDLLRRLHPDTRDPEDEAVRDAADAALQQTLAAYAVLGDPHRRADYDKRSTRPRAGRAPRMPHGPSAPLFTPISTQEPPIRVGPVRWHTHHST